MSRPAFVEPIDPDVAAAGPGGAGELGVLASVALGGVVGAIARYEVALRWPTPAAGFPWTTLAINLLGSALLPIVVVLASEVWTRRRLLRPALGTGVLGGFTTFSTFAVDQQRLLDHGHWPTACAYTAVTVFGCLAIAWPALVLTRRLAARLSC
jgi:CrcB protein